MIIDANIKSTGNLGLGPHFMLVSAVVLRNIGTLNGNTACLCLIMERNNVWISLLNMNGGRKFVDL